MGWDDCRSSLTLCKNAGYVKHYSARSDIQTETKTIELSLLHTCFNVSIQMMTVVSSRLNELRILTALFCRLHLLFSHEAYLKLS